MKKARDFTFRIAEKRYNGEYERNIQRESIILTFVKTIFESAIEKMELAVALPSLISDPELFRILTIDETNVINSNNILSCNIEYCSKYLPQTASMDQKLIINAHSKRTWYNASKCDYIIYKILKIFDKHIDILRTNSCYKHISMPSALFLYHIGYFLEHILCRMYLMPEQVRSKELHYRKLWRCQKTSIEDIAISTMDLERQRNNHKKMLEDIVKRYRKNMIAIDEIDKKCNENITNTNIRHEKKQFTLYKAWEFEQNEIKLALKNVIDDFESLKDINTKLEQTIHKRRLTTESKLLGIMTKYDIEIGSRYRMLEELREAYNYDKLEKHVLQKEMKQQEEVYVMFLKQKEEIGITHSYINLSVFKRERSARIIQRWWRKIFWNGEAKKRKESNSRVSHIH